jgi:hypothetical protein
MSPRNDGQTRPPVVYKPFVAQAFSFKTANPEELRDKFISIAQSTELRRLIEGTEFELHRLPNILVEGEDVLAFSSGHWNNIRSLVVLTDRRIMLLGTGFLSQNQVSIYLEQVNSISHKRGLIFAEITIQAGATSGRIVMMPQSGIEKFIGKVQETLDARRAPKPLQVNQPVADRAHTATRLDVVDALERLAKLMKDGILTQEEFNSQKAKLLGLS